MKKIRCVLIWLSLLVGVTFSDPIDVRFFRNDYKLDREAGGWLKFHKVPASFTSAFQRCKAEGAVLASPLTKNLQEAMVTMLKANSNVLGMFTGIHATFSKGDFTSVEGVPLYKIPVDWAPNEPDNYRNNEDCTIMVQNGSLADVQCNDYYPYLCFKKYSADLDITKNLCGIYDDDYIYESRTEHCYKFHRVARTWRLAAMTCMAEGGYLAIINSATEVQVIKDIFAKVPPASITSPLYTDVAAIGIHDWGEHGVWYTVHGETLQEAGYSTFVSGEPNNNTKHDGGSFCGGVFRSGLLDDIWCNEVNFPFICEKDPASLIPDHDVYT